MKLYQYAVILHPTNEEAKTGKLSEVIVDVTATLAADEKGAILQAARKIPEQYMTFQDRLEVAVRPF